MATFKPDDQLRKAVELFPEKIRADLFARNGDETRIQKQMKSDEATKRIIAALNDADNAVQKAIAHFSKEVK